MAKKICSICGTKIKKGDIRCRGCGIALVKINRPNNNKVLLENVVRKDSNTLEEKTLFIIERLSLFAKVVKVFSFFGLIAFAIYSLFNQRWICFAGCLFGYFLLPFVSLPISWMQMMLENIYTIRINSK